MRFAICLLCAIRLRRNFLLRRLDASTKEYVLNPSLLYLKLGRQEGAITLWDADSGREIRALRGHEAVISALLVRGADPQATNRDGVQGVEAPLPLAELHVGLGELDCELRGDRVLIAGRAVEYLRGEIVVPST